jgi:hypothetical protein
MLLQSTGPGEAPRVNRAFVEAYGLSVDDLITRPMVDGSIPTIGRPCNTERANSSRGT